MNKKTLGSALMINDDCFNVMRSMEENGDEVDIILTSPPYNTTSRKGAKDPYNKRYDKYQDNLSKDEYAEFTTNIFNEYDKILAKNGVILYNLSYSSENTDGIWITLGKIISDTAFTVADTITWKKKSAIPNNRSKNKLTRITEFVFVIVRKKEIKTFNANKKVVSVIERTGQKNFENVFNFFEARNNDGPCELNKATFSSEMVEHLLKIYGREGSVVLDNFMGTGTTAIGCENLGMRFIGVEMSETQWKYSVQRLSKHIG